MPEIVLEGCSPVPLASYLKALGVFRLVAEQKDKDVRGCWRDETFVLDTTQTKDVLVDFFVNLYRPSPVISPWNGRAGFLEGDDEADSKRSGAELVRILQAISASRFASFKSTVNTLLNLTSLKKLNALRDQRKKLETRKKAGRLNERENAELNALKKHEGALKTKLIAELRGVVPEEVVAWMDACWRVGADDEAPPPAPLLGSGGNDGSRDLGVNFGQQLSMLFDLQHPQGKARPETQSLLKSAIFGVPAADLKPESMGQFAPGQAGPNAGVGFGAAAPLNPWDTVLSLEGAIVFAGATTRRLGGARTDSSFPFTVHPTGAAGAASVLSDEAGSRGEIWLPLWRNLATFSEIAAVFSEGRATLSRRPVRDGLDFARAAVSLGVNRGISSFQRYSFMKREGRSYIAAPLTRIHVRRNAKADLLSDLDRGGWLQRFRDYARRKEAPARLRSLAERLDEAAFALTQTAGQKAVQDVLIALGEAAACLATSQKARDPDGGRQKPPPCLGSAWFHEANDGSPEFCIAAALAGLGQKPRGDNVEGADAAQFGDSDDVSETDDRENRSSVESAAADAVGRRPAIYAPPFRAHLAPLDENAWHGQFRWGERTQLVAWGMSTLERNLIAVLERRLTFAAQRNLAIGPFDARAPADLASVLTFLWRATDDGKIAALAQGLAWAEAPTCIKRKAVQSTPMPLTYAVMKPFFAPFAQLCSLGSVGKVTSLPFPPELPARLRAGSVGAAFELACRRARASALPVTFAPHAQDIAHIDGLRLLASLLIPIRPQDLERVVKRAYPDLFKDKDMPDQKEAPADAA